MRRAMVTLGGRGSPPLTSSSVYSVANCLAQVTIHPSVLRNLTSSSSSSDDDQIRFSFSIKHNLNDDQSRTVLLIMLQKLIISASEVSPALLNSITDLLNRSSGDLRDCKFQVNAVELDILNNSAAALIGIFTLMHHEASCLSAILDVVAALGCEASKADVSTLLNNVIHTTTDDAFYVKEETCVASHCKILLNGYEHVGQPQADQLLQSVAEIPRLHGCFRRLVASLGSIAHVELNTSTKAGSANAMTTALMPLLTLLGSLCRNVTSRSSIIAKSLGSSNEAVVKYVAQCPKAWGLQILYETISSFMFTAHHVSFAQHVHRLLRRANCTVHFEALLAFVALQGDSTRADNKIGKAKMEALGQGNAIILQHIRDTIESQHFNVKEGIFEMLDYKNSKFDSFLKKIKETLDRNVLNEIIYSELGRDVDVAKATLQRFIDEDSFLRRLIESLEMELVNVKKEKEAETKHVAEDLEAELQNSKLELETCMKEELKVRSICDETKARLEDLLYETQRARQDAEDVALETESAMKVAEVDRNLIQEYEAKLVLHLQEVEAARSAVAEALLRIKLSGAKATLSKEEFNSLSENVKDSLTIADMKVSVAMEKVEARKKDSQKTLEARQKELEEIKLTIVEALEMEGETEASKIKLESEIMMLVRSLDNKAEGVPDSNTDCEIEKEAL